MTAGFSAVMLGALAIYWAGIIALLGVPAPASAR
jgi:hypothetical protein